MIEGLYGFNNKNGVPNRVPRKGVLFKGFDRGFI